MANSDRINLIKTRLDEQVSEGVLYGGGINGNIDGTEYSFTSGYADYEKTKPFTDTTIFRQMSDTKIMGTVAFLALIEDGILNGHEPLAAFLPAFANTKVIHPVFPEMKKVNVMTFQGKKSLMFIPSFVLSIKDGDKILIRDSGDIHGIPADEINGLHTVHKNFLGQLVIDTDSEATSSDVTNEIQIAKVDNDVKVQAYDGETYLYTLDELDNPIEIWHVLTHTLGYMYNQTTLQSVFGYAERGATPYKRAKRQIQAGILGDLQIPAAAPIKILPLSSQTVLEWANELATVPLLYQPGTDWSYGPTLALLGAVSQVVSGQTADDYFKSALTQPLGMHDTGFFTDSSKADRFADLLVRTPNGWAPSSTIFPEFDPAFNYGDDQPKSLVLYDGGSYTTLKDRALFYDMLRSGGKDQNGDYFISPALISLISTNQIGNMNTFQNVPPTTVFKWGLGSAVGAGTDEIFTMSGQTTRNLFWNGAFNTSFSVDFGNNSFANFGGNMLSVVDYAIWNVTKLFNIHMSAIKTIRINEENIEYVPNSDDQKK